MWDALYEIMFRDFSMTMYKKLRNIDKLAKHPYLKPSVMLESKGSDYSH